MSTTAPATIEAPPADVSHAANPSPPDLAPPLAMPAAPTLRIHSELHCGVARWYVENAELAAAVQTLTGWPTLTAEKLAILRALGVNVQVTRDNAAEAVARAARKRTEKEARLEMREAKKAAKLAKARESEAAAKLARISRESERAAQLEKQSEKPPTPAHFFRPSNLAAPASIPRTPPAIPSPRISPPAHSVEDLADLANVAARICALGIEVQSSQIVLGESEADPLGAWHVIGRSVKTGESVGITGLNSLAKIARRGIRLLVNTGADFGGDYLATAARGHVEIAAATEPEPTSAAG